MSDVKGKNTVSKVLLQPRNNGQVRSKEISSAPAGKVEDFQLNSLGGPLEEDFTG